MTTGTWALRLTLIPFEVTAASYVISAASLLHLMHKDGAFTIVQSSGKDCEMSIHTVIEASAKLFLAIFIKTKASIALIWFWRFAGWRFSDNF